MTPHLRNPKLCAPCKSSLSPTSRYLLRASKGGKSLIEVDDALDEKFWEVPAHFS